MRFEAEIEGRSGEGVADGVLRVGQQRAVDIEGIAVRQQEVEPMDLVLTKQQQHERKER
jgi:hypothetical protein